MRLGFTIFLFWYFDLSAAEAASYEIKLNVAATEKTQDSISDTSSAATNRNICHFDEYGRTTLYKAVESNNIELVTQLIKNTNELEIRDVIIGYTPLAIAIVRGHLEIVKLLLNANANPEIQLIMKDGYKISAIDFANKKGKSKIAKMLEQEIENRRSRSHAFILALEVNKFSDADNFLAKGILTNYKNEMGWTPLLAATHKNKFDLVKRLLELKSDPNVSSNCGKTPLHIACNNGDENSVRLLLDTCANNSAIDKNLLSPLIFAVISNNKNCIKLLLEDRANVNVPDHRGNHVIDLAIQMGNKEIIKLLRQNENCCAIQ